MSTLNLDACRAKLAEARKYIQPANISNYGHRSSADIALEELANAIEEQAKVMDKLIEIVNEGVRST